MIGGPRRPPFAAPPPPPAAMARRPAVDFFIVGAQKCGTTTLFDLLDAHPLLAGCPEKEPHFFSSASDWRAELDAYEARFPPAPPGGLRFEASTTYAFFPRRGLRLAEDLRGYNPDAKIIYIVREPVARVVSHYMHLYERGYIDRPFEDALFREPGLLDHTRYATQLAPYLAAFGRGRVRVCFFEELVRDPGPTLRDLGAFLGVDPAGFPAGPPPKSNKTIGAVKSHVKYDRLPAPVAALKAAVRPLLPAKLRQTLWAKLTDNSARAFTEKPRVSPDRRAAILHLLRHEITELEALTGRDLSAWRTGASDAYRVPPGPPLAAPAPAPAEPAAPAPAEPAAVPA